MEGVEMEPDEQQMHQRRRWMQMSQDEKRERREQQRLWYRRRRSRMTDQEIALQNERRRLRYRLQRSEANGERVMEEMDRHQMHGLQISSDAVDEEMTEDEKMERLEQQRLWHRERRSRMTGQLLGWQNQRRRLKYRVYRQQRSQARGGWVMEERGQHRDTRCQWRIKSINENDLTGARFTDLNEPIGDAPDVIGEDRQSDDSEMTETDESLQDMLPGRQCGAPVRDNQLKHENLVMSTGEARPFEEGVQTCQPDTCEGGVVRERIRLSQIRRQARAMHSHSVLIEQGLLT